MAKEKPLRVVLDCNWYISAAINASSREKLYFLLTNLRLEIFYSQELITEFSEVIVRKKFSKYIPHQAAHDFIKLILPQITEVKIAETVSMSRDPKDNYLLGIALSSKADFLVTGDDDLLALKAIGKTKIVTMKAFFENISK